MFLGSDEINPERYDALIVGSGPAGAGVALSMSARGKRALIIETGTPDFDYDVTEAFSTLAGRGHYTGEHWTGHWVRAFGGTSWAWNGWCIPLSERTLATWPVSRVDLDPFYLEAAGILGLPPAFLTYGRPAFEGFTYRPFLDEPPMRFGEPDLGLFQERGNVDVLLNTTVTGIAANTDRTGVTGMTLWQEGAAPREIALRDGQALVLAAGGMGNAQILLASRDGDGAAVGNERDQVGRYLMEHPHVYDCARAVLPESFAFPGLPEGFGSHVPTIVPDDSVFAEIGGMEVSIEFDETTPNFRDPVEIFLLRRMGGAGRVFQLTVRSEMAAEPTNRVQLGAGTDPSGLPRLDTVCVIGSDAFYAYDQCLHILGDVLAASGPGRVQVMNEMLYREVYGGGHTMGTTRMGVDPATSVVDADCRVHGYRNLFVAGSSVFRTGGYENPTLTIVALAARLGDHLAAGI